MMVLRTVSGKLLAMTANVRITKTASPLDILERAEKLLGRDKIAEGLRVSKNIVESWCDGTGTLSNSHLLRLADLLAKYADANR
ncbi:MAG: hypothetical protein E6H77_05875 [Betaproteobacteria bacterium]|nr:MAG: hypothetical protein E6H77_05875 [Betaproteobacteria bacterium]